MARLGIAARESSATPSRRNKNECNLPNESSSQAQASFAPLIPPGLPSPPARASGLGEKGGGGSSDLLGTKEVQLFRSKMDGAGFVLPQICASSQAILVKSRASIS